MHHQLCALGACDWHSRRGVPENCAIFPSICACRTVLPVAVITACVHGCQAKKPMAVIKYNTPICIQQNGSICTYSQQCLLLQVEAHSSQGHANRSSYLFRILSCTTKTIATVCGWHRPLNSLLSSLQSILQVLRPARLSSV